MRGFCGACSKAGGSQCVNRRAASRPRGANIPVCEPLCRDAIDDVSGLSIMRRDEAFDRRPLAAIWVNVLRCSPSHSRALAG